MRIDGGRTLNPGRLRHQITWEHKSVVSRNTFGQDNVAWLPLLTVRAEVKSLSGRERENAQQRWAEAEYQITQHYTPGLERAERGSWYVDGAVRHLDILDAQDRDGDQRVLVIIAKEWVA